MPSDQQQVTLLLQQWSDGDKESLHQLMPLLYDQLHRLASSCLRAERRDHTLRATALVHEAYLRLVDSEIAWENRVHFYAVAVQVLRHILADYAKASGRQKRGGDVENIPVNDDGAGKTIPHQRCLCRSGQQDCTHRLGGPRNGRALPCSCAGHTNSRWSNDPRKSSLCWSSASTNFVPASKKKNVSFHFSPKQSADMYPAYVWSKLLLACMESATHPPL
jgi:hypothetical protein